MNVKFGKQKNMTKLRIMIKLRITKLRIDCNTAPRHNLSFQNRDVARSESYKSFFSKIDI